MIHGSPGSNQVLKELAGKVSAGFRVIVPDLPGFGASTHSINDYSFRAHAAYILALLDQLRIERAHFVGFSMGGGVVLSLAQMQPARVASITMLSAIGVQEEELSGNYWMNHVMHGMQVAILWAVHNGVPHFGWLDGDGLNVEYARNFYDSDQRPLRAALAAYKGPMLILHGTHDRNVPPAAALEHHRLVPQSELLMFEGDHFMAFQQPEVLATTLLAFLRRHAR